jgi:hypothetical protein
VASASEFGILSRPVVLGAVTNSSVEPNESFCMNLTRMNELKTGCFVAAKIRV